MPAAFPEPTLPSNPVQTVVVIGAGLAGLRTAQALRTRGFAGDITVIGSEPLAPYDRPPLSKRLLTNDSPVFLAEDLGADLDSYASEILYSTLATDLTQLPDGGWVVSTVSTTQTLADPSLAKDPLVSQHHADAVVLALGSTPFTPSSWVGTRQLYSWNDASRLQTLLRSPRELIVIGAGWIGSEVAAVAAEAGHTVTVLEAGATPLERQVGSAVGARLAEHFENVSLLTGVTVTDVSVDGASRATVAYIDGSGAAFRVTGDVVLSAIGARPNTSWLAQQLPLSSNGAVRTDALGRVIGALAHDGSPEQLVSGLYAVGDCALRQDEVFGTIAGGHWNTALTDPERIASHIVSATGQQPNQYVSAAPHVFSTQFGRDLNLFGTPNVAQDAVVFREGSAGSWTALYLADGPDDQRLLTGVFTCDAPRDAAQARKMLARGPIPVLDQELTDITKPLKNLAL